MSPDNDTNESVISHSILFGGRRVELLAQCLRSGLIELGVIPKPCEYDWSKLTEFQRERFRKAAAVMFEHGGPEL